MHKKRRPRLAIGFLCILIIGFLIRLRVREYAVHMTEQQKRNQALIAAIRNNNTQAASAFLAQGAAPNSRYDFSPPLSLWQATLNTFHGRPLMPPSHQPALLLTIGWRQADNGQFNLFPENVPLVKALLNAGADVNARGEDGATALQLAAYATKHTTLKLLLQHGADVNLKDSSGKTALMWATEGCDEDSMRLLIQHGADVNARDYQGKSALDRADKRFLYVPILLRQAGARN